MGCNCKVCESVLAIVILVFAIWWNSYSQWVIGIAAAVLLLHSFMCKSCMMCDSHTGMSSKNNKKRK